MDIKGKSPIRARQGYSPVMKAIRYFAAFVWLVFGVVPPSIAATYDIGPAQTYTNLGSVPWTILGPGDTVNIHYQPGGYHEVILLSQSGAQNSPITITGIPDPVSGALPVIDGHNAVTATNIPWSSKSLNTQGVIVVAPSSSQGYGYIPSWIVIQNLEVQHADPTNTVTRSDDVASPFAATAGAIYVEFAQHLTVQGCVLNDSANGFFCGTLNNDANQLSAAVLVQNCWFHDNGFPGNFNGNDLTTECMGIQVQYCLLGMLRPGANGDLITDRSSGTVLAYNEFIVDGAAFWLANTENGVGVIDADPAYHTSYVYGNVFYNPTNSTTEELFLYDALYFQSSPRNGTLYFYNNTVVNQASPAERYNTSLFALPDYPTSQAWNLHDTVDCRNNIFATVPPNGGGSAGGMTLLNSDDGTINLGTNWISPGFQYYQLPYQSNTFFGAITGTNQLFVGDKSGQNNPGFVNVAGTNFQLLSSSRSIDAAGPQSPAVLASIYNVVSQYVYPTNGQARVVNGLRMDLGAFEGVSTNYTGPLFSLTVSNGFGTGGYPSNSVVQIAASNAPAGQMFAGWTGYPVANPLSIGTTFSMPPSNITVTATYSNVPYYSLTVVNGTGGGSYLPGTVINIGANPPPSGEVFANWTGYAVANASASATTITMPATDVTVTATYSNAPVSSLFHLNVINGNGSGSYVAGSTVNITANSPATNQTFAGWTGFTVANAAALSTSLIMPGNDVTVTASYQFSGPLPSKLPQPITSHPRLWLTTNDLAKYRSWAVSTNPIYTALQVSIQRSVNDYQTQYFPGGVPNANYPDFGDSQGYTGLITESDAVILAFASLIDPNATNRSLYAQYTRNLLIYALSQAELGTLTNAPFRDPSFAIYNRSAYAEDWALAVDWIYNAKDTNGQPILSAADKLTIRNGFMTWASQCLTAETTGGDSPSPVGVLDTQQLLPNGGAYRMAANNYYLSHARLMTMMALAVDAADDPAVNTNLSVSTLGNSLRSYLDDAIGSWMYQENAMFGDPSQVIGNYGLAPNASVSLSSGGMPSEGMLYGESIGSILMSLLSLQTAGYNDPNYLGPQAALITSPVWARYSTAMLSSLVPAAKVQPDATYLGPIFLSHNYGDMLRSWVTPQGMVPFALQSLLERYNGATNHYNSARWFLTEATEGGSASLAQRVSNWSYGVDEGILYFMLLDPTLPPAPDPRPQLPLAFQDYPFGHIVDRTGWTNTATQFDFLANWISINHQQGSAGQFELYRKGEWLTKQLDNYDDNLNGQSSMWHNTLSLQNWCSAGDPNLGWGEQLFVNGSEYMLGESAGDPVALTSSSPSYTYATADLTPLYNRPQIWQPQYALMDIQQATRDVIWIKPDHIIVYDRAASTHSGLFKQFNLNLVAAPTIAGNQVTELTPGGQKLFVQTLLPANASITYAPINSITTISGEEPSVGRVIIADTNNPATTRFLHVIQGADSSASPDAITHVASTAGNAFEGATVRGAVVMFPISVLSNNFTSVTYSVPVPVTNNFIAGLRPGVAYTINQSTAGGSRNVTITPGPGLVADAAGLLSFNSVGQTLSGAPRFVSAQWMPSGVRLGGTGMINVSYRIQTCTNLSSGNWSSAGSATADGSGNFQFNDNGAQNRPQSFYRAVWP